MAEIGDDEIFERVVAAYQTFDAFGNATYKTAVVWARPDDVVVEGVDDPFLVWTVVADRTGNAGELRGFDTEKSARHFAESWLGSDREVPLGRVPESVLNWVFVDVRGWPLR